MEFLLSLLNTTVKVISLKYTMDGFSVPCLKYFICSCRLVEEEKKYIIGFHCSQEKYQTLHQADEACMIWPYFSFEADLLPVCLHLSHFFCFSHFPLFLCSRMCIHSADLMCFSTGYSFLRKHSLSTPLFYLVNFYSPFAF